MSNWTDLTDYLPDGFALRKGAGGGDPRDGMCYMETVAFIAGEKVTDRPGCACPALTTYGITLNDCMPDDVRQQLIPLAWATAGTRSPEHEQERMRILGLAACDMAEMVLPAFEAEHPNDNRPRKAIEATRMYWAQPNLEAAQAEEAARDARGAAQAAWAAREAALAAEHAAWAAQKAAAAGWDDLEDATTAAWAASKTAARAAKARPDLAPQIWDRAIQALRDAIEAGPHGGIPEADAVARIEARKHELVGER